MPYILSLYRAGEQKKSAYIIVDIEDEEQIKEKAVELLKFFKKGKPND